MKTKNVALAALMLLLGLAACNKSDTPDANGPLPAGEYPVIIQATGLSVTATPAAASNAATRATVDGDWQGVATVAVEMDGAVKEYTVTASDADGYQSATLSRTDDPFYWTSRNDITVSAWWPCAETLPAVKVAEDQSTLAAFQNSDFISAENQTVTFSDPKLTFTHRTARVTVVLKPGTGIASVAGATVSLASLSAEGDNPTAIKTCNTSGNIYEALAAPQTVAAGEPFIQVELGDGTFYFRPQNNVVLEAGSRYTYTVNVNATGLTLAGCEIDKWEPGQGKEGDAEDLGYSISADGRTYTVYNAKGLLAWNEAVQEDMSLNCTLAADITLPTVAEGESNWTPMGYYYWATVDGSLTLMSGLYTGTFDGGGHTITGLTVDLPNQDCVGLIGRLDRSGTVQNLTLAEVEINGSSDVGGVVGENYGTVTGCTVSGTVKGNGDYVGGVAGNNSGTVTGCTVSGDVEGAYDHVGGVAGWNSGPVTGCTVSVDVTGNDHVGGVAGGNYDDGTVTGCYATGDISGNDCVGGVAGWNSGTVTGCTVSGTVKGNGDFVGGVAGATDGTVTGCYATGYVSGNNSVGGVAGYNYGGTVTGCYWSNYDGSGIGGGSGGDATKVDGTTVTWIDAQRGMNEAIDAWNANHSDKQCNWRYAETDAETPPVLTEQ